ncbi:hypothetical protein QOT17_021368 [Balamuthia mandrillaris]
MDLVEHEKEQPYHGSHMRKSIPKASKTRYASYARMAGIVEEYKELLHHFLQTKEGEHTFADEIQTGLYQENLRPSISNLLQSMCSFGSGIRISEKHSIMSQVDIHLASYAYITQMDLLSSRLVEVLVFC